MANGKKTVVKKEQKASLKKINYKVAGIDLGSEELFIAVIDKTVQKFPTFTRGLESASEYLKSESIEKVVMEATGVYWIPVFEYLERQGFHVSLVNGAHAKNVSGRKTDVLDSEWLRELHTYGLLRASFIPDVSTCLSFWCSWGFTKMYLLTRTIMPHIRLTRCTILVIPVRQ